MPYLYASYKDTLECWVCVFTDVIICVTMTVSIASFRPSLYLTKLRLWGESTTEEFLSKFLRITSNWRNTSLGIDVRFAQSSINAKRCNYIVVRLSQPALVCVYVPTLSLVCMSKQREFSLVYHYQICAYMRACCNACRCCEYICQMPSRELGDCVRMYESARWSFPLILSSFRRASNTYTHFDSVDVLFLELYNFSVEYNAMTKALVCQRENESARINEISTLHVSHALSHL